MDKSLIPEEQAKKQNREIQTLHLKEEEDLAQQLATKLGLPYMNLVFSPVQLEAVLLVPQEQAKAAEAALIRRSSRGVYLAVRNPQNTNAHELIEALKKNHPEVNVIVVSLHSLKKAWAMYPQPIQAGATAGKIDLSSDLVEDLHKTINTIDDLKDAFTKRSSEAASALLEIILAGSLGLHSSDIHVEATKEDEVLLRLRIDGIMHTVMAIPTRAYRLLLSRVKLLAHMKINIKGTVQEGRFSLFLKEATIEIRASVVPSEFGENMTFRVLDPAMLLSVEELGMRKDLLHVVNSYIAKPNGTILVTGPTGSGKTTTLYAFIKALTNPSIKILTVEDPIEYHLDGVTQTQTNTAHDYTFANALRSVLRQDPNVILVGEVRDADTAEAVLQAAFTGHLVFSTLHTVDAPSAIPRLVALGAPPALVAPALNLIISQRLLRLLCQQCKKSYKPTHQEFAVIEDILETFPTQLAKPSLPADGLLYMPGGCTVCHNTGYKSRSGIFEILATSPELQLLIREDPPAVEIRAYAKKIGMSTLLQDAVFKILEGKTSLAEVNRVLGAQEAEE